MIYLLIIWALSVKDFMHETIEFTWFTETKIHLGRCGVQNAKNAAEKPQQYEWAINLHAVTLEVLKAFSFPVPLKYFIQHFCNSSAEFLGRSRLTPVEHTYISTNSVIILLSKAVSIFSSSANYTAYTQTYEQVLNKVENLTKML